MPHCFSTAALAQTRPPSRLATRWLGVLACGGLLAVCDGPLGTCAFSGFSAMDIAGAPDGRDVAWTDLDGRQARLHMVLRHQRSANGQAFDNRNLLDEVAG